MIERYLPESALQRYEVHNFRHAAEVLAAGCPDEMAELVHALEAFHITRADLLAPGGNESAIPRRMAKVCDGLACIIESDAARQGARAGSFQGGESIFGLLCSLGAAFDSIGAKADLGDSARAELLARAKGAGWPGGARGAAK